MLDEVLGDDSGVTGMRVMNVKSKSKTDLSLAGVFIAVGHAPNTELFKDQLDMSSGYLHIESGIKGNSTATSILVFRRW